MSDGPRQAVGVVVYADPIDPTALDHPLIDLAFAFADIARAHGYRIDFTFTRPSADLRWADPT